MKKLLFILLILLFVSCKERIKDTYYIVGKTYEEGHMCHSNYETVNYAAYIHTPPRPHHHTYQKSKFILHIANRKELLHINIDSISFLKYQCGNKIIY